MDLESLKYTEIIKFNKELKSHLSKNPFKITILGNIMTHYLKEVLEFVLRSKGLNTEVEFGDYDNILQHSSSCGDSDVVLVFWEAANLVDGFQYKIDSWTENQISDLENKIKAEMDLVFNNLSAVPLLLFNRFSNAIFNQFNLTDNRTDQLVNSLNFFLDSKKTGNLRQVHLNRIFYQTAISECVSFRDYYSSKSLYTVSFFKKYAEQIAPYILSAKGKAKKALILDCDNTLWKGIVGEDGFEGIQMSAQSKSGIPFEEVQYLAKSLSKKGVILGLCSKNNPEDVDNVIQNHPDFKLTEEEIVIKKVNWEDKATNLRNIAKELNIGLDSLVFVDDSDFEVNLIKSELPEVEVIQVPKKAYLYPNMIREAFRHFFNLSLTAEDLKKAKMYKEQSQRTEYQQQYKSIEDYLKSLELQLDIYVNDGGIIPRMAQMTQKTNQFNLTTKRYTEQDVKQFVTSTNWEVLAFGVKDKFGDSGITGLAIIRIDGEDAEIDTLLMSCRVLGRKIEHRFIQFIITHLKEKGITNLSAQFIRTLKNKQVQDLYDRFGFEFKRGDSDHKFYSIEPKKYFNDVIDYIQLNKNLAKTMP